MASRDAAPKPRLASALSGAMSGMFVSAIVQPLDVVRTRMQVDVNRGVHLSTWKTLRLIVGESHWMGLWRGTQPTILRVGVGAGLNFFFIESIKPLLSRRGADGKTSMGPLQAAFTGGAARAIAAVVSCPITVVKTRMEFGTIESRGTVRAMRSIVRSEGVPGLFRGLGPTILSGAPFAGVYYLLYTRLQSRLQEGTRWQPVAINFTSGAIAAVTATILTQPFDVARTQIQLRFDPAQAGRASAAARLSSLAVLRHIGRSQGARGLLAGTVPRILKRALQTAFIWVFYEEIMGRVARHRAALEAVQEATSPRVAK